MIDFQQALDDFSIGGEAQDPITAIYNILPSYSMQQQKYLFLIEYFIKKYDLDDVSACLDKMQKLYVKNKNLGMLQQRSLQSLLASYTQNEMIRGIKVNAFNNNGSSDGAV